MKKRDTAIAKRMLPRKIAAPSADASLLRALACSPSDSPRACPGLSSFTEPPGKRYCSGLSDLRSESRGFFRRDSR